jgi:hypothetical protein
VGLDVTTGESVAGMIVEVKGFTDEWSFCATSRARRSA